CWHRLQQHRGNLTPRALRPLLRGTYPARPAVRRDGEQRSADQEDEKQLGREERSDLVGPPPQRVGVQSQPTCQAPDPLPDATHAVHSVLGTPSPESTILPGAARGDPSAVVNLRASARPGSGVLVCTALPATV